MRHVVLLGVAGLGALMPLAQTLAQGQPVQEPSPEQVITSLSGRDRVAHLAVNGALGGFSAAMFALARGKNPWRAALVGFGGGVAMGAGKQVAGKRFHGAGLIGRQIAALGTSFVRSASEDTMVVILPVGPMTFRFCPRGVLGAAASEFVATTALLYYVLRADTRIDLSATASAGAPVFRFPTETVSTRDGIIFGRMDFGTIVLGAQPSFLDAQRRMTLPHESIHVVQYDFLEQALTAAGTRHPAKLGR